MNTVKIKDKTFRLSIPESDIMKNIQAVADQMNRDLEGKTPLLLAVLNGSFMFAADLMRICLFYPSDAAHERPRGHIAGSRGLYKKN